MVLRVSGIKVFIGVVINAMDSDGSCHTNGSIHVEIALGVVVVGGSGGCTLGSIEDGHKARRG